VSVDIWAVQQRVYTLLKTANVASGAIYDHVPPNQWPNEAISSPPPPYVEIGEGLDVDDDTTGTGDGSVPSYGVLHTLTLHVWSRARGQKEIKQIVAAIRVVLHQKMLTVTGLASCMSRISGVNYLQQPDGVTYQAVVRVDLIPRT